jgi:regulator of RNase E activity RraA
MAKRNRIQAEIIDKIRKNRISTTEVADCLNKSGHLEGIFPLNYGHFRVGPVFWAYAANESNWELHKQIRDVRPGDIVLIEPFNCGERAVFGSLVSKFLLLYRQAAAIVIRGYLRDIPHLRKENWPIWYMGGTPIGCFNRSDSAPMDKSLIHERSDYYEEAIAVCDDSGVVVITRQNINEEFIGKLDWIEEQEDIWFDCIDRLKWNTYETVCLKKYLNKK